MAVTITATALAEAIGVDSATATRLLAVATALVERYALEAPERHIERSGDPHGRMAFGATGRRNSIRDRGRYQHELRTDAHKRTSALRRDGALESVEGAPRGGGMTQRLALRRFPNEVVRRRQGPGTRNFYGEFEPGPVVETIYPARVLPLDLEDSDFVGGVSLLERLKVFVPRGIARRRGEGDALEWGGEVLTWNGESLRWGGDDGTLIDDDSVPFLAAFDDRQADILVYAGVEYVVEESQSWPRYSRAIALRET